MSSLSQQTKSAITLKGSAEILCEYLGNMHVFCVLFSLWKT